MLRIRENTGHLRAWREGRIEAGGTDWLLGEALDVLARTGDVPVYDHPRTVRKRYRRALVGGSGECTWGRLYLSRKEVAALAVLIVVELGLNLTTVSEMAVPEILPGTAEGWVPVYRLRLEKRRRAGHRGRFESRNLTDSGADSLDRIVTEALEATAHTRALLARLDPQSAGRLLVWRQTTPHDAQAYPRAVAWARSVGLSGSPLRRLRKTVNVLHRREPGQNSQDTHDRVYVLPEPQAQQAAVPVIAEGALGAVADAHRTVFAARLAEQADAGEVRETATAGCADYEHSPFGPAGQSCAASFLLCTACPNARVTPAHHPRLAHLHQALGHLRGVLEPRPYGRRTGPMPTPGWKICATGSVGRSGTPRSPRSATPTANRDRALCHRLDAVDARRLDRCRPSCANVARTDHHADQLLQHAQTLEKQAASEAVPGPLADGFPIAPDSCARWPTATSTTASTPRSRPHEPCPR